MSGPVRAPAVAGLFYPEQPEALRIAIDALLAKAKPVERRAPPKVLIVPHAGLGYSGPVAATAYALLRAGLPQRPCAIARVVLLGPCHRVAVRGLAITGAAQWQTPLGSIPIDRAAIDGCLDLPAVEVLDAAHADEHSLEVQLPFLQVVLGNFALAPFAVGDADADDVARVLDRLWGGPETLIVISTDLSHYLDHASARARDAETAASILALDGDALSGERACGYRPVRGLLDVLARHKLGLELVDLRNSGDTSARTDRVVGYAALVGG